MFVGLPLSERVLLVSKDDGASVYLDGDDFAPGDLEQGFFDTHFIAYDAPTGLGLLGNIFASYAFLARDTDGSGRIDHSSELLLQRSLGSASGPYPVGVWVGGGQFVYAERPAHDVLARDSEGEAILVSATSPARPESVMANVAVLGPTTRCASTESPRACGGPGAAECEGFCDYADNRCGNGLEYGTCRAILDRASDEASVCACDGTVTSHQYSTYYLERQDISTLSTCEVPEGSFRCSEAPEFLCPAGTTCSVSSELEGDGYLEIYGSPPPSDRRELIELTQVRCIQEP